MCVKTPFCYKHCAAKFSGGLPILLYRLQKSSLFGTDPCKNHTIIMFFSENEINDVKAIIPSNMGNHVEIVASDQE